MERVGAGRKARFEVGVDGQVRRRDEFGDVLERIGARHAAIGLSR